MNIERLIEALVEAYVVKADRADEIRTRLETIVLSNGNYSYLDSMIKVGFLTMEEADKLKDIQELPKDKTLLIALYVLSDLMEQTPSAVYQSDIHSLIRKMGMPKDCDMSIIDAVGVEEAVAFMRGLQDIRVKAMIDIATTFVRVKRRRIREELKWAMLVRVANALSLDPTEDEESEEIFDETPNLRAMAVAHGYRPKAKTLNDSDRKAIEICANYYLDLLELLYLNGEGDARMELFEGLFDEENKLKESYYYEDEVDEALMMYADVYVFISELYTMALSDELCYEERLSLHNMAKIINSSYCTPKDLVMERLLNTKFKEYAVALSKHLKDTLSTDIIQEWEDYINNLN